MNGETGKRDIKNHLLFEVATEVANRGMSPPFADHKTACAKCNLYSGWNLLGAEVESPGHNRRIWREIYPHWPAQQELGMLVYFVPSIPMVH